MKNVSDEISLSDGTKVSQAFYIGLMLQVKEALPLLVPGVKYTLKKICGNEFWNEVLMGRWERILAGKCIAHMVAQGCLPLDFAGLTRENSQQYQLK